MNFPTGGGRRLDDLDQFALIVGFLSAALYPGQPQPALVTNGEQGFGKTTESRVLKTLLDRSGIDLRTLMELAGHPKPELTVQYSHHQLNDPAGTVDKLPTLVPDKPNPVREAEAQPLRATGTDGRVEVGSGSGCSLIAGNPVRDWPSLANPLPPVKGSPETKKPLTSQGFSTNHSSFIQRGRRDSNPQPPDRQSGTVPSEVPEFSDDSVGH